MKQGDWVKVIKINQKGTISSIKEDGLVTVVIGSATLRCKQSELLLISEASKKEKKVSTHLSLPKSSKSPTVLDLHGYDSQMAKEALLKFISDSIISGHREVSVIHGHGSGTIKRLVQTILSQLDAVASFRHPVHSTAETKVYLN